MPAKTRRNFLKISSAIAAAGLVPHAVLRIDEEKKRDSRGPQEREFINAVRQGNLPHVKELMSKNRQLLSLKDESGVSCYAIALLAGHVAVADFLKTSGYQSDLHESALALDWEQFDRIARLKEREIVHLVNSDHPIGGTAMFAAAAGGAGANTWRIYGLSGDPNASPRGRLGVSPIQKALRFPDLKTAEVTAASMLSNNTNPNPGTNAEKPPLCIAAERGSLELVEMLVRLGANVDATDNNDQKAWQLAGKHGHNAIVKLLKSHEEIPKTCHTSRTRYDVNGKRYQAADLDDIHPMTREKLVGQSHRNLEFVKESVSKEPRMAHSVATTSEICVEACAHTGNIPIVEFLLGNGSPYSLPTAVMMNDMATVKRYLDEDPNRIHERGAHDFALLWYPVIGECPTEMMELLIQRGGIVEQQHFLGTTALHWAVSDGNMELVELLIANGANVNRTGRKFSPQGETPLMVARDEKIIRLLKEYGAR